MLLLALHEKLSQFSCTVFLRRFRETLFCLSLPTGGKDLFSSWLVISVYERKFNETVVKDES